MNLEVSKLIPWKNQKQYIFTAATANCLYSCDNKEDSEFCVFLKHFIYQITDLSVLLIYHFTDSKINSPRILTSLKLRYVFQFMHAAV